jgi:hypothetical protein
MRRIPMSFLFGGNKMPSVESTEDIKKKKRKSGASTILTSPLGIEEDPNTQVKTLLGQ